MEKIPWRRKWQLTPVFLPREILWAEEPGVSSSWGRKELDTTEWLNNSGLGRTIATKPEKGERPGVPLESQRWPLWTRSSKDRGSEEPTT